MFESTRVMLLFQMFLVALSRADLHCPFRLGIATAVKSNAIGQEVHLPAKEFSAKCEVTSDDIGFDDAFTEDNTPVREGDKLKPGQRIHIGDCKICRCTKTGVLRCYPSPNTWVDEDNCIRVSCTTGYERVPYFMRESANCSQEEKYSERPYPQCYECVKSASAMCEVTSDDIGFDDAFTEDDTPVREGDKLKPGQRIRIGDCKICRCTASGALSCYPNPNTWVEEDECVSVSCSSGYERRPFFIRESANCTEDETYSERPYPLCYECMKSAKCDVTIDDMGFDDACTDDDAPLKKGEMLKPGQRIRIGDCKICQCTKGGVLNCHPNPNTWVEEDKCISVSCTSGYERLPFFIRESANCTEDETYSERPYPQCYECVKSVHLRRKVNFTTKTNG